MLAVKSPKGKAFKIFHGMLVNLMITKFHEFEDFHLPGSDETFTAALGFGIDSAVGSTYNFMPQVVPY